MKGAEKLVPMSKNQTDTRIALIEQSIIYINDALLRIEKKIDNQSSELEKKFEKAESRLIKMDDQLDKFNNRLWSNFLWLIGTMFTLATLCCGIMAKGFEWF